MQSYRYLALGDSYTIGEGIPEKETWPHHLVQELNLDGIADVSLKTIARTGWTSAELLDALDDLSSVDTFSFASVLIGVNDQYRGLERELYRDALRKILDFSKSISNNRTVCLSIPDWGVTPFGKAEEQRNVIFEINSFNEEAARVCGKANVAWVDITPISRTAADDPEMLAPDGLHYSGKMYGLWAKKVLPFVRRFL